MTLREKILNAKDIREETLEVPEWGCKLLVRGLTGAKRAQMIKAAMNDKGVVNITKIYPQIIISTVHDPESGAAVFQPTDADALNEKSGEALEKVAQVAVRLSGLAPNSAETAEKNSPAASDDSTSSSPENSAAQ